MKMTEKEMNIYHNLKTQADKVYRHIRTGSYKTRSRYYAAVLRFLRFLSVEYRLKNIQNIDGKHLIAYVLYMEAQDLSERTVKTDLSAIRWFHDFISCARHRLPNNDDLGVELPKHVFTYYDRSWTDDEYLKMRDIAIREGYPAYDRAMQLGRLAGLRVHEVFKIDTATARAATRTGSITIVGKGGKSRTVPCCAECIAALADQLAVTAPGQKLFVPPNMHTDRAINRLQLFLWKYRDEARDQTNPIKLTFHGLRHSYAAEKYTELRRNGASKLDAYLRVSALLGHNRGEVSKIYTASVDETSF